MQAARFDFERKGEPLKKSIAIALGTILLLTLAVTPAMAKHRHKKHHKHHHHHAAGQNR
jgi:multidrug efflux pump subunit AcrB